MRNHIGQLAVQAQGAPAEGIADRPSPRSPHAPSASGLAGLAQAWLREGFPSVMGRRVLELGCGSGDDLRLFASLGAEAVIGVDAFGADLSALSASFRDLPVDFVSHDFRGRVPLWRASADLTLVNRIRLPKPDPESLLREAKYLTVPGGLIHVLAPYPYQSQPEDFGPPIRVSDYFRMADGLGLGFQGIHEAVWGDTPPPDASRAPNAPALLMLVFRVYS